MNEVMLLLALYGPIGGPLSTGGASYGAVGCEECEFPANNAGLIGYQDEKDESSW